MGNGNHNGAQLHQARLQKEQSRRELFEAQERLKQIENDEAALNRSFDPQSDTYQRRKVELERKRDEAEQLLKRARGQFRRTASIEAELFEAFKPISDPREQLEAFKPQYPFLLLPLRIETRFKADVHQMWLRVYPDDVAVDSFEPTLSENEIANERTFWAGMWAAGGNEGQERAVWRSLVASHGAGRARWIIQNYGPTSTIKPTKTNDDDVILAIPTDQPLSPTEASAVTSYWKAVWLADNDFVKLQTALNTLRGKVGGAERAAELVEHYRPFNLTEKPATKPKDQVISSVIFVEFPPPEAQPTKRNSWSQSAKVHVMPERLIVLGYVNNDLVLEIAGNPIPSPLVLTPDPSGTSEAQITAQDGDLVIGDDIRWMTDFERAVEWGLGFKIDLNVDQFARGFDRLLVLGVRLSADEQEGKELLQTLLVNHHFSSKGLTILPQGTPTNNTDGNGAGYSRSDDADATFQDYVHGVTGISPTHDEMLKSDGQWFSEYLGIDLELGMGLPHANGQDQAEARAMNLALFPSTLGYMLQRLLKPTLTWDQVRSTRWFFTRYVSGRGAIPAIRIGNQPYGILPTTAFSRMRWVHGDLFVDRRNRGFLPKLYEILRQFRAVWEQLAQNIDHVGKQGDAHQILLNIVGLHPSSVEFYSRYAESESHLYNLMNIQSVANSFQNAARTWSAREWASSDGVDPALLFLRSLGYTGDETPLLFSLFFWNSAQLLQGPVIDDQPLSETNPIRKYTLDPNGKNYLQWLADTATTSLDALRKQDGFIDNTPPDALLYILLRFALMNGFHDATLNIQVQNSIITLDEAIALHAEPEFIHIKAQQKFSESRWEPLYRAIPEITNSPTLPVGEYIAQNAFTLADTTELKEQIQAVSYLADTPTARLERLLAEHVDTCSYRLDAWLLGLVHFQLDSLRRQQYSDEGNQGGIYLGAYGWLENVRPENKLLTPVQLPEELEPIFNPSPEPNIQPLSPLMRDSTNGGYIHAPSLNQAVTAAVLRNGYISNATPQNPDTLAINLSSERVRIALSFIEGMRNGQSLSALLGYQLERGLHDRYALAEVDEFIFDLRKAFPLRAKRLKLQAKPSDDAPDPDLASIESLEARNVINGLSLIEHIKRTSQKMYPFGKPLPAASNAQKAAINTEVDRLLDIYDALADLAMAEGVHQVAQGNYDRAAATLDAYGKSSFPPIPDVVQTPRSGITLTHRVGLHLKTSVNANVSPVTGITAITPRAQAEPALNDWLASLLPNQPNKLVCNVQFTDPITGIDTEQIVSWQNLQLQPIDLLYIIRTDNQPAMSELDDRIVRHILATNSIRPDVAIQIQYIEQVTNALTFFQIAPLIQSLRALTLASRPLTSNDVMLQTEAAQSQDEAVFADPQRVLNVRDALSLLRDDLQDYVAGLETIFADLPTLGGQLLTDIDTLIQALIELLVRASSFGIPQSGWGFIYSWKGELYTQILSQVQDLVDRWDSQLDNFDHLMVQYGTLTSSTPDEDRFSLLQRAELLISAALTTPRPATPDDLRILLDTRRATFEAKRNTFADQLNTSTPSLASLYANVEALLPIGDLDITSFDLTDVQKRIVTFSRDLLSVAQAVAHDADKRINAAQEYIDAHSTAAKPSDQVKALQDAAKTLLGDDFRLIPEFSFADGQGDEWNKALIASQNGTLFQHLTQTVGIDFPVDDWLYGTARVREKMAHWERLLMLSAVKPELTSIQLPYQDHDSWLGLEFPPTYTIDSDRLLYTAHYATPFNKAGRQCGLLLDEWTEVIPGTEETTGITFHYDRPSSEPPQTLLLVTSALMGASWSWDELVAALHETLELARLRAVEPDQIDDTPLNRFLPAAMMAMTLRENSISANLAINNGVLKAIRVKDT